MDKITSNVRRQQWLDIIQACNASGLTKKAWCEQNGIVYSDREDQSSRSISPSLTDG